MIWKNAKKAGNCQVAPKNKIALINVCELSRKSFKVKISETFAF